MFYILTSVMSTIILGLFIQTALEFKKMEIHPESFQPERNPGMNLK